MNPSPVNPAKLFVHHDSRRKLTADKMQILTVFSGDISTLYSRTEHYSILIEAEPDARTAAGALLKNSWRKIKNNIHKFIHFSHFHQWLSEEITFSYGPPAGIWRSCFIFLIISWRTITYNNCELMFVCLRSYFTMTKFGRCTISELVPTSSTLILELGPRSAGGYRLVRETQRNPQKRERLVEDRLTRVTGVKHRAIKSCKH